VQVDSLRKLAAARDVRLSRVPDRRLKLCVLDLTARPLADMTQVLEAHATAATETTISSTTIAPAAEATASVPLLSEAFVSEDESSKKRRSLQAVLETKRLKDDSLLCDVIHRKFP
jgi:hypothetical protein